MIKQHLSNKNCCECIAENYMTSAVYEFMKFIDQPGNHLIKEHVVYLDRALKINKRMPIFYFILKAHKNKIPCPSQLVVAQIGSPHHVISKVIDAYLQELLPSVESCIRDSDHLLQTLKKFGPIDDGIFITTADAVAMRPNIDNDEALMQLTTDLDLHLFEARPGWPRKQIIKGI